MSGRARVTLADGRKVIGFRKTLRQTQRARLQDRPELRFTFLLPPVCSAFVSAGEHDSATVDPDGLVTFRGKDREWVLQKAGEFLNAIVGDQCLDPIPAQLFCPAYPGLTAESPVRPGYIDHYEIVASGGSPCIVIARTGLTPKVVR